MEQRIQATARAELRCEVTFDPIPLAVCDVFREPRPELDYPNERSHHLTILFRCRLPRGYEIDNLNLSENDQGYLKWFYKLPEDFLKVHDVYHDYLQTWLRR
jgi:colanic acid biosynthesis protein WcaH